MADTDLWKALYIGLFVYSIAAQSDFKCTAGLISYVSVCNRTTYGYSAGCLEIDPQSANLKTCLKPLRGFTCTAFSLSETQNATCLTPNICGSFNSLKNASASKPYYAWDLTTKYPLLVEVKCEHGYERSDGMGFSGATECLDNGTFMSASFTCVPVMCGKYCRYCNGKITDIYCPQNQPCCCTEADTSQFGRYISVGLALDRPLSKFSFPGSTRITCTGGYDVIPGSGSSSPRCIPRDDCVWEFTPEGRRQLLYRNKLESKLEAGRLFLD
jgi:hypothetical protein